MDADTTILEEDIDENYEPTQDGTSYLEIEEYAIYLGLDLDEDQDLLYIAREGLKAPLPAPWKPCQTKNKDIFYFNFDSQESVWEHPCDKHYKEKVRELKAAKSKRKGEQQQRPARTPPSAGKSPVSAPPKPLDLASKGSKASVEMEEFRQELEAEKAMVLERNEGQLEEYKKELKGQLNDEEQRLRSSLESEKEQRMAEKRKSLAVLQDQERERVRAGKQQRLDSLKASLNQELEQAKRRHNEENSRATALFLETESRRAQEEMRTQSRDVDQRLSQLRLELSSAQAALSQVNPSISGFGQTDTAEELARIQASKDSVLRAEIAKEKSRYESELLSIQSSLQARLSSIGNGSLPLPSSLEDMAAVDGLRQDCERDYQANLQAAKAKSQEKLLRYRQELENRYETERQAVQTKENRILQSRIDEEKRRIAEESSRTLQEYSRGLDREAEDERRRLEEDWSRKLDNMRSDSSRTSEAAAGLERELTALQEKLRQREREVEQLRKEADQARRAGRGRPVQDTQGRVEQMAQDLEKMKRMVVDASAPRLPPSKPNDPIHEWRTSLLQMKQEIKEFQRVLSQEKRVWMADCDNYRDHPSAERKAELQAVKRVLDQQIVKLNEKVRELKLVENWIRRQEGDACLPSPHEEELEEIRPSADALEPDDDVLVRWRYGMNQDQPRKYSPALPVQPYVDQKFQVYQRFLNREAVQRDQIQTIFMRQNAWISNMKEELAKVHFAPRPRTSYYY